jgi:hypothetical protein
MLDGDAGLQGPGQADAAAAKKGFPVVGLNSPGAPA